MSPAGQLRGHLVGSAFIHIRVSLPQDYPHIRMWLQHLAWFWPPWVDIEWRAWLEAKGVDLLFLREPTPGGTTGRGGELLQAGACILSLGFRIQTLSPGAKSLGSENLRWGSQSSRPQTRSLEPQCGGSLEPGLTASSSRGGEPTLEAVGSGQVLLCACLAHRRSGWTPDSLAGRQGQALHGGANVSTHGTPGPGCLHLSTLSLSLLCPQEPHGLQLSLPSVPPAASRPLSLEPEPPSQTQTQGDLQFLGLWVQKSWLEGSGWASVSSLLWDLAGMAPSAVKWAQKHPCLVHHPVRWPQTGPKT